MALFRTGMNYRYILFSRRDLQVFSSRRTFNCRRLFSNDSKARKKRRPRTTFLTYRSTIHFYNRKRGKENNHNSFFFMGESPVPVVLMSTQDSVCETDLTLYISMFHYILLKLLNDNRFRTSTDSRTTRATVKKIFLRTFLSSDWHNKLCVPISFPGSLILPPLEQTKRDPGLVWSRVSWTIIKAS